MKRLLIALLIVATPVGAAEVSTSKSNFANAASTACTPNGAGTTSGHTETMFVQSNGSTAVTIASTRIPTWVQDVTDAGSGDRYSMWHGVATSTGAEVITVSLASGTELIGSFCGEYTGQLNNFKVNASIIASAGADIILCAANPITSVTVDAPFTQRQVISFGGTDFVACGDQIAGAAGLYPPAETPASNTFMQTLCTTCAGGHTQSQLVRRRNESITNKPRVVTISRRGYSSKYNSQRHGN